MPAFAKRIFSKIRIKTLRAKTGSIADPDPIRLQRKDSMKFHCTIDSIKIFTWCFQKICRHIIFFSWSDIFYCTWFLFWLFIKVDSILNCKPSIFDCLVGFALSGSTNSIAWSFSLTSFHIIPWCFAVEIFLMVTDNFENGFVPVLTC